MLGNGIGISVSHLGSWRIRIGINRSWLGI
jgi:hypothetical protein